MAVFGGSKGHCTKVCAMRLLVFSLHIVLHRGKFTGTSGGGFAVADPWQSSHSRLMLLYTQLRSVTSPSTAKSLELNWLWSGGIPSCRRSSHRCRCYQTQYSIGLFHIVVQ
eukprot:2186898-Amphidinium_carterae.1